MTALSGVQVTSAGSVGFQGSVAVDDQGLAVTATGGVQFADDVTATTGGGVTITNGGTLQIANGADFQLDGSFTQNGAGNVVTGGDITTTGDNVSFASSVRLTDSIAIDTTNGGAVVGGADITFSSTVDATGSGVQGLTINAGTMGDAIFTGAVGGTTRLGGVVITQANDVQFQSTVSAASILQQAGTGTTTFQGAVNTNTASGISLTGTSFTFNGPVTTTSAGGVTIVHTGLLDIAPAADFMLDGAFLQTGTGQVQLAGDITTTGDMILFQGPVTLTDGGTVALNTTAGGQATGADVTFQGTLNSSTAGAENLLIDAGTMGDVQFAGTVGATARLGDVTIQNANDVLIAQAFTADSLTQLAGTGTTTTDGLVTLHEVAGLNLMADRIVINGGVDVRTAGNNGAIALQAGSEVVINSTLLSGGGSVSIASNDDVRFTGTGQVDSTAGNVTVTADADGDANGMGGALLMADGAQVLAGSGTVSLSADENIVLGQVATTNNGANAVTIVSSSGGVVDGGDADVDIVAATGQVTISASTGIGSGDALETTSAAGQVRVETLDGTITVTDGDQGIMTEAGGLQLIAGGATSDILIQEDITTHGGDVALSAGRNVASTVGDDITTTSAANSGIASGNVTIAAQGTGSIQLAGDVVTTGATGGASGGDVMLSTVDGSIQLTGVDVSGGANAGGMGGAAGTVTAVAGDANTSNDSNIVLTGAITALGGAGASAGADGTVTMSAGGAILDGNDGSTLISTGDLSLTAVTSIGTIDDFATQTGDAIDVMVSGELTRLATTGDESEINLNVMGDLVAASGAIEPGVGVDGDLLIQTSGNLDVGTAVGALVLTSGDDVGLHAQGTLVIPDAGIDVGTGQLALTGGVDVVDPSGRDLGGGDTTLLTNVDTLTADLSTSPAGTTLTVVEEDSIELVRVSTNSGDIEVRAATMAAGDIVVDQIDAGTAMVSLDTTTMGGAILDGSDAETDIVAGTAVLRATTGIGSTGPLEIDVNTLAATTVAGDLRVCDVAGGLVIGTVDGLVGVSITSGSVGDDIEISALGPLTVDTNVTNIGGGAITLASEGTTTDRDLTINGSVTTSGGDGAINLFAGDSVIVAATGLVHASNAGEVTILAGTNFNKGGSPENGTATGSVQMASGAVVGSDDGNVVVRAPGDVEVALINADLDGDGTRGNITVQADFDGVEGGLSDGDGAIRDALAGEAANLVGAQATLLAASGIGATDDIDSDLDTVSITNTTDGNVVVTEIAGMGDNDLTVLNATNMQDDIDIRTIDGQLTVTGPVSTTGAGAITLVAGDSDNDGNGDLLVNGAITGENGTVSLQSVGNDVRFSAAGDVTTTSGQIDVTAGSMTQDGEIFQEDGSVLDAGDDRITLTAFGNVTLGQVKTLSTADDAVTISTTRGVIDGGDSGGADIDVSQGRVVIQAVEGVGDTNAIETQAGSIDLTNTTSGDVQINETDDVTIFGIDQAGPGDVTVTSGGTQTVTSDGTGITAASGNILLDANGVESSIVIESTVQTTVGMVQLQADQDIVLTSTGIVQTTSGNIDLEADTDATRDGMGGAITMADGSQILSDSGMIRLLADSDITVGRIVTSTQISIESVSRGIVDAGDTGGVDLQAEDLALRAATGIGSDNAIETSVSQLAAFNQIAGNIRIDNSSGSLLTIGVVDGLSGVTQGGTAGGWIEVNHIGALTVDAPVVNVSGGGIVLTAASNGGGDDDLTINDVVMAPGENGDILFLVDDGLYINDSGSELDIYGKSVTGHAGGKVIFSDDVIVASFTGSITQPTPEITSVTTPQVTATGIAVVETEFGREDESNFTFVFVWDPEEGVFDELSSGDAIVSDDTGGVIGVVPTDGPNTVTVDNFYPANPNEANPSADIPITVILFDDPNITFTSAGVDLGVTMVTSLASVPGEGLVGFAVFDLSIEVELQSVADFLAVSSERVVIIERIGPDGKVARDADGEPIREELYGEEAQQVLADLPGLFMKLKEGHWRIYMKEGDDAQQQLVRDVELHDGRPAAGDAGTQDRPPTGESDVMEDATPMDDAANDDADDAGQDANADADNSNAALPVPENVPQGDGPVLEPARGRQAEHGTNANVTAAAGMGLATVTPRSAVQSLHVAVNRALRVVRSWSLLR
ncbi:Uncharacterized protein SCF082_LOCUS51013 [Durusdinium trenchii]|uniref:Uncharacterized protein n=1 Tax=Durusdinium trenchii TaxID=1381693 RepID=A0ABP0SBS4_9DINO